MANGPYFDLSGGHDVFKKLKILRLWNKKNSSLSRVQMQNDAIPMIFDDLNQETPFIRMAFASRNRNHEMSEILTFNIPNEQKVLKAIFNNRQSIPQKIFSMEDDRIWRKIEKACQLDIDLCVEKKSQIMQRKEKSIDEAFIIFTNQFE